MSYTHQTLNNLYSDEMRQYKTLLCQASEAAKQIINCLRGAWAITQDDILTSENYSQAKISVKEQGWFGFDLKLILEHPDYGKQNIDFKTDIKIQNSSLIVKVNNEDDLNITINRNSINEVINTNRNSIIDRYEKAAEYQIKNIYTNWVASE